jgi:hypothetical protein
MSYLREFICTLNYFLTDYLLKPTRKIWPVFFCLPTLDHFPDKISSKLDSSGQKIAKFNQQLHCRVSPAKKERCKDSKERRREITGERIRR